MLLRDIPEEVREQMCRDYKRGLSLRELSAVYGSSVTMVHSIVRNSCEKKRGRPCGTDKRVVEAMVIDYQNGLSVKRLAKKYHFAENSVYIVTPLKMARYVPPPNQLFPCNNSSAFSKDGNNEYLTGPKNADCAPMQNSNRNKNPLQ